VRAYPHRACCLLLLKPRVLSGVSPWLFNNLGVLAGLLLGACEDTADHLCMERSAVSGPELLGASCLAGPALTLVIHVGLARSYLAYGAYRGRCDPAGNRGGRAGGGRRAGQPLLLEGPQFVCPSDLEAENFA